MTSLSSASLPPGSAASSPTAQTRSETLGQDAFLRLLTTQLVNQSPLDPMSNEQFVAQMAQFSAATGIADLNDGVKGLRADLTQSRLSDAAGYLGRSALVAAAEIVPGESGVSGEIKLAAPADDVAVRVVNRAGATVRTIRLGPQDGGSAPYHWDGRNQNGDMAAGGPFFLKAEAISGGRAAPAQLYVRGLVSSVALSPNGAELFVEGVGKIAPGQVASLS